MATAVPSPGHGGDVTTVRQALAAILADAAELGLRHAIIGGLAVSTWTEPRTTRDVDLAVNVEDDARAEALVFALQQRGYLVEAVVEQESLGRLATARLRPPGARRMGALVDLLFASSGVESEVVSAARSVEVLRGVSAPVASVGHLIALKLLSRDDARRPQDRLDLASLMGRASAEDLAAARRLSLRIMVLGTNRGRDLPGTLEALLREHGREHA